jgi:DNA (cytosine-5)-methyltransferase 1
VDTITAKDRFGLAMVSLIETMRELNIVDIGFRMLDCDELSRAQGFPDEYKYHGTRAEIVRQIGNAVCPPVSRALCETIANTPYPSKS